MAYYITYGEFQYHLKEYYQRTGNRMQFPEMTTYLYQKGLLQDTPPREHPVNTMYGEMTDAEFDKIIDSFVLALTPNISATSTVNESDIIPQTRDAYVIRHPRYTRPAPHIHNYFELDFVASGECTFVFENEERILKTGELCIIAPHSRHDLIINDDTSTVFCIMIRKSTFNTTFFSLMSQKNLLSYFFRTILQGDSHANYLLFYSEDVVWLKNIIRNAMSECHKGDALSNNNCISWIHLFFSHLIRNYSSYPLLTINVDKPGRLYGGDNAYILITGNVVLSHNDNDAYCKSSFEFSGDYRSTIWGKWEYIYCRLKWGTRWWNGSAWQSSACDFKLYFDTPDNKKMKNKLYQSLALRNTVKWWSGIDKDGYAIPVPAGVVLNDEMVFTMYSPAQQYDDAYTNSGQGDGRSYWIWIKDFGMEAVIANPDYTGAADTDTVYTNVINSSYVNELDEIKFKICTWDGKKPNYSSVVRYSGDGYYYADTTYNAACAAGEAQWRGVSGATSLRQEEHLIYRLVNQYATPSVILTLPLHGGLHPAGTFTDKTITNRIFIIDSYSMDYKANKQTVRLVEKK